MVKDRNGTGPVVYIPPDVYGKIMAYVNATSSEEISGLGTVQVASPHALIVREIILIDQECSSSETELDQDALFDFFGEFLADGGDPDTLKLWWHSHAWMGTFWSSTDDATIERFQNPWMLSLVFNKRGAVLGRLDTFKPLRSTIDALEIRVLPVVDPEVVAATAVEVAQKVRFYTTNKQGVKIYADDSDDLDGTDNVRVVRTGSRRAIPATTGPR